MDTNTMGTLIQAADHAAMQSDRWLFVALLLVFLSGGVVLWRWMVADREAVGKRLTDITDRHIAAGERLAEVVANNTVALKSNSEALAQVSIQIARCEAVRSINQTQRTVA